MATWESRPRSRKDHPIWYRGTDQVPTRDGNGPLGYFSALPPWPQNTLGASEDQRQKYRSGGTCAVQAAEGLAGEQAVAATSQKMADRSAFTRRAKPTLARDWAGKACVLA